MQAPLVVKLRARHLMPEILILLDVQRFLTDWRCLHFSKIS